MEAVLEGVLLLISVINMLLHSLGCALLVRVAGSNRQRIQRIYLINLSISVITTNAIELIKAISAFGWCERNDTIRLLRYYSWTISYTGGSFVYYAVMYFITCDRLAQMILSLRYTTFWNKKKAIQLLVVTWVTGILISTSVCITHKMTSIRWEDICFRYVFPSCDFTFVVLAFTTYLVIYRKTINSRIRIDRTSTIMNPIGPIAAFSQPLALKRSNTKRGLGQRIVPVEYNSVKKNRYTLLKNSVFYIPFFLIASFLVFMVTPDIVILFLKVFYKGDMPIVFICCSISYAVCNFLDALIYIYYQPDVRRLLYQKILKVSRSSVSWCLVKGIW